MDGIKITWFLKSPAVWMLVLVTALIFSTAVWMLVLVTALIFSTAECGKVAVSARVGVEPDLSIPMKVVRNLEQVK